MSRTSNLMTEGVIWKQLVLFSIPLLIGNLFQQLYNTVDSIIVGNFVGSQALAAVGASTPIINLLVGFFMGIATGAGIIISQFFGARDESRLKSSIHTSFALSIWFGIFLPVAGIIFSPYILRIMGAPADVFDDSVLYLRIYFLGSLFLFLYNMGQEFYK
ncbi:MAG: MATE family efflux transporter [Turicibacter sp.]|nr:MATE family efflux transporter [Turicibacter sp.]